MLRTTLILAAVAGMATVRADDDKKPPADAPYSDATFVKEAGCCYAAVMQSCELATTNAKSQAVKALAARIKEDHKKTADEWMKAAEKTGVAAKPALDEEHQKCLTKLKGLEGAAFDKEFLAETIKGHEMAVKKFKQASKMTKNDAVKEFAADTLPILEKHLDIARKVQADGK